MAMSYCTYSLGTVSGIQSMLNNAIIRMLQIHLHLSEVRV